LVGRAVVLKVWSEDPISPQETFSG
jgi:hypothetical protein